jgi:hypothetical protein
MKLGMYIMTHMSPSERHTSYIPPHNTCACMCILLSLLGNGSVYMFSRQRIHETINNCWMRRFLCGPCRIKESLWVCLYTPLSLQSNGSVKTFPQQRTIVRRRFLCGPCCIKGTQAINSSQNFLLLNLERAF